jgi:bacteriocin biosynthesis cyclodehydratase domain-containing protein
MRNADGGSELQRRLASSQILFIGTGLFGATTFDVLARSGCGAIDVIDWDDDGAMLDSIAAAVAPPRRSAHLSTTSLDQLSQTVLEWIDASDLVVTATREAPWALFERLNLLCLERMRPLLRANVNGADLDFGPHVIPFDSACIACVRARQMSADPHAVENELVELASAEIRSAGVTPPLGESIVLATQFAGLVGTEAIKIITRVAAPSYVNMVTIVSPFAGRSIESHVLRVPRCFACSRRGQLRVQHQGGFTHA